MLGSALPYSIFVYGILGKAEVAKIALNQSPFHLYLFTDTVILLCPYETSSGRKATTASSSAEMIEKNRRLW